MKTNKALLFLGGFLAICICSVSLFLSYRTLLTAPNTHTAGGFHDGIKNYYTLWYHVANGKSINHFEGMNYPYGEQVVFTDNQPLLSNTLRFINQNVVPISDYTVGIVNVGMFLTYLVCCVFLYLIFLRLKLPWWYAAFFATILTLMAPQMTRIIGHYSLSYACYIPIIIYLLLRFHNKRNWQTSLTIGLVVLCFGFLHMYYLAIAGFLLAAYLFFDLVLPDSQYGRMKKLKGQIVHFALQIVLPFFVVLLWLKLSDTVPDRPETPSGFLYYISRWESILLPVRQPIGDWISNNIFKIRSVQSEGVAYLGLVTALAFVVLLLRYLFLSVKKIFVRETPLHFAPVSTHFTNRLLIVGICGGLFACGVPFIFNLAWLVEYLGPIKQFRSIGRFAWIAYFMINIALLYCFYHLIVQGYQKGYKNVLKYIFAALLFLVPIYETQSFLRLDRFPTLPMEEYAEQKEQAKEWMKHINVDDYQAIVPLPYYHIGSENFLYDQQGYQLRRNFMASLQSTLPMGTCFMSRTSLQQSLKSIEWKMEPYGDFAYLKDLPNEKSFLLWVEKEFPPKGIELEWLKSAEGPIYEHKDYSLYHLDFQAASNHFALYQQNRIDDFREAKDSLYNLEPGIYTSQNTNSIVVENYENRLYSDGLSQYGPHSQEASFNGSQSIDIGNPANLFQGQVPEQEPINYLISYWVKIDQDRMGRFQSIVEEVNKENNEAFASNSFDLWEIAKCVEGNWVLVEQPFQLSFAKSEIRVRINSRDLNTTWSIDELLIRPEGVNVYQEKNGFVIENNRWYKE